MDVPTATGEGVTTKMGDTLKVRITEVPEGEAPLWVREGWIGVVLEGEEYVPPGDTPAIGVLTGLSVVRNFKGSIVCTFDSAVEALRTSNPEAARWWDENHYVSHLVFIKEWFEILEE